MNEKSGFFEIGNKEKVWEIDCIIDEYQSTVLRWKVVIPFVKIIKYGVEKRDNGDLIREYYLVLRQNGEVYRVIVEDYLFDREGHSNVTYMHYEQKRLVTVEKLEGIEIDIERIEIIEEEEEEE